jgi:hypothetical protein
MLTKTHNMAAAVNVLACGLLLGIFLYLEDGS